MTRFSPLKLSLATGQIFSRLNRINYNAHSIGGGNSSSNQNPGSGNNSGKSPRLRPNEVALSEVKTVQELFMPQLYKCSEPLWVQKNFFCTIRLRPNGDGRPPALFGRVKACYPTEGYLQNVEYLEIEFPRWDAPPAQIMLSGDEIITDKHDGLSQSFYLRVRFLATVEDISDFEDCDSIYKQSGFVLEPGNDFTFFENLHLTPPGQNLSLPWLYIICSKWIYYTLDASIYNLVLSNLHNLLIQKRILINYHPSDLPSELQNLNGLFGYIPGVTSLFFPTTHLPTQSALIVENIYQRMFAQPLSNIFQ